MSTHRYNTRYQSKKNVVITATAPAVPPPIKLPEKTVFIPSYNETIQEIQRILNLAQNTPLKSIARYETVIELFMFILANQQHVKYHKRLVTVIGERATSFSNEVERSMKSSSWHDITNITNRCPQHLKEEAQRHVLYRVMKTLFNHVKNMCDQWKIDMDNVRKMALKSNIDWQGYE